MICKKGVLKGKSVYQFNIKLLHLNLFIEELLILAPVALHGCIFILQKLLAQKIFAMNYIFVINSEPDALLGAINEGFKK